MKDITLKVDGMTCTNCEKIISRGLKNIEGVSHCEADFKTSFVKITYDPEMVPLDRIESEILDMGYKVVKVNKYKNLTSMLLIILMFLFIISLSELVDLPEVESYMSYGMLIFIGFLTSFHCIAMCGGINISQSVNFSKGKEKWNYKPSLLYNLGRVFSYTIIGGVVGSIGSVLTINENFRGYFIIAVALFMIALGMNLADSIPFAKRFNFSLPKSLKVFLAKQKYFNNSFMVGVLNGFMPCGPLQTMQLYALGTGSFIEGAASMFFFSIGTVPLMFLLGAFSTMISRRNARTMVKASGYLIIILGLIMFNRGLNLNGFSFMELPLFQGDTVQNVKIKDNIQYYTAEVYPNEYPKLTFKKGMKVVMNFHVDEDNLTGCNNEILIPEYNIDLKLSVGDNIVEFTPDKTGVFTYTCWMGMITNTIEIIE